MKEIEGYTIRQTANILGVKVRTVREWLNSGKLYGFKDDKNGRWVIAIDPVNEILIKTGKRRRAEEK